MEAELVSWDLPIDCVSRLASFLVYRKWRNGSWGRQKRGSSVSVTESERKNLKRGQKSERDSNTVPGSWLNLANGSGQAQRCPE